MNEKKMEITSILERNKDILHDIIAVLNLPGAYFCRKAGELVLRNGQYEQACQGCVNDGKNPLGRRMSQSEIREVIDYFAENYGAKFITINGRGDPFHPLLKKETLDKVTYAASKGIQSYIFTAGNELDHEVCDTLAENKASVMISLYGNDFIDADFFLGKAYPEAESPVQNQGQIAGNLRMLIDTYRMSEKQPEPGATRIGMNYVVTERDIADGGKKLSELKKAANDNGLFFVCNTPFQRNSYPDIQAQLEKMADEYSNFHVKHSTSVNGQCQMGAGSAATVECNGELLKCPYMDPENGDGKFFSLLGNGLLESVLKKYMGFRDSCAMRKQEKDEK